MRRLFLFIVLVTCVNFSFAQSASISEGSETMKSGAFNALKVELPNTDKKVASNVWKDYIKSHGAKAKKVRKSKEMLASGAEISGINDSEPIEVYSRIDKTANGSRLTVWFGAGGVFVSSEDFPSDYSAAERFLQDYSHEVAKELVVIEMEDEEDKLKDLESEMKKLKKKNDGYHKDIEKAKKAIEKAEKNIEDNEEKQKDQESVIEKQKKALEAVKNKLSEM